MIFEGSTKLLHTFETLNQNLILLFCKDDSMTKNLTEKEDKARTVSELTRFLAYNQQKYFQERFLMVYHKKIFMTF